MITFFRKELTQSKGCKTFKHMILAYNLSPTIKDTLAKIDALNNKLLLIPLSLKNEQRLKWETTIARIYWSLILSANPLSKNHMAKILVSHDNKKREGRREKGVNKMQDTHHSECIELGSNKGEFYSGPWFSEEKSLFPTSPMKEPPWS